MSVALWPIVNVWRALEREVWGVRGELKSYNSGPRLKRIPATVVCEPRPSPMTDSIQQLEFVLNETRDGAPVSPSNVDFTTIRQFIEEVEALVRGDSGESVGDTRLEIREGSLILAPFLVSFLAAQVNSDLGRVAETGNLDSIQPARAQILQKWQKRVEKTGRTYELRVGKRTVLQLRPEAPLLHKQDNAWVKVERYLTGRITHIGGKKPNLHVRILENNEEVIVAASVDQLANERENQIYKDRTIHVAAEQNLKTKELRDIRLLAVVPWDLTVDEESLSALWKKGRAAWADVASPSDWVEHLRGNR